MTGNLFFDTCVYRQPGIDPETGHHFDDTRRYIDALGLSQEHRRKVFELNARHVHPRLDRVLKAREPVGGGAEGKARGAKRGLRRA